MVVALKIGCTTGSKVQKTLKRSVMSIIKVIEIMANSPKSWEDAAQNAINEAGMTLKGIKSIYIKEHSAEVTDNKITSYRITAKISFEIFHHEKG